MADFAAGQYQYLTPEEMQRLVGNDVGMQNAGLEHQLALAQGLRQANTLDHTTGAGGTFGGIAHVLNGISANRQESQAAALRQQIMAQDRDQRGMALKQRGLEHQEEMEQRERDRQLWLQLSGQQHNGAGGQAGPASFGTPDLNTSFRP